MTVSFTGRLSRSKMFKSDHGEGLDLYVEDREGLNTAYLQVVFYDQKARDMQYEFDIGDSVRGSGKLKVKTYTKRNGSSGFSLVVENPSSFEKVEGANDTGNRSHAQDDQRTEEPAQAVAREETTGAELEEESFVLPF